MFRLVVHCYGSYSICRAVRFHITCLLPRVLVARIVSICQYALRSYLILLSRVSKQYWERVNYFRIINYNLRWCMVVVSLCREVLRLIRTNRRNPYYVLHYELMLAIF